METKNIMQIMIVALVGAIILVGFVPVIGATQDNIGDSITITNPSPLVNYCDYYTDDVVIVFDSPLGSTTNTSTTITIGDWYTDVSTAGITEVLFIGDTFFIQISPAGNALMGIIRGIYEGVSLNQNMVLETEYTLEYSVSDGNVKLTSLKHSDNTTATVFEVSTSVFFAVHENGGYSLTRETYAGGRYAYENMAIDPANITTGKLGASAGTTSLTVGESTISVVWTLTDRGVQCATTTAGYTLTGTVNVEGTLTLVEGTTDIYKGGTPTITINAVKDDDPSVTGSITFTPEASYVLRTVNGHATTGALYDVYGLIPLIVAVGLLMFVITAILIRRV